MEEVYYRPDEITMQSLFSMADNIKPDRTPEDLLFQVMLTKHIFFIAETKGSMSSFNLRCIELAKIACAKRLFNSVSTSVLRYGVVDSYQSLMEIIGGN